MIFSIAISTFNALTFSPMLSALLLARESKDPGRKTYAIAGTVIGFVYGLLVVGGGAALALAPTACLLYTSPSPRDTMSSRMPSSA